MKALLIPILVGALSIGFFSYSKYDQSRVTEIESSIDSIHEIIDFDKDRQQTVKKIIKIIRRFNRDMPVDLQHKIANEIYCMSVKYPNLDADLICATITHESARTWDPEVVSIKGAMGLMQIMPATGTWLAKYEGIKFTSADEILFNPIYNIRLGTRYLSALIESYDLDGGLAAYNGGATRVRKWLANDKAKGILWAETQDYIPNVLKLYDEFRMTTM